MQSNQDGKFPTIPVLVIVALIHALSTLPSFAEQVRIPGTSVSLDSPDGFTLASSFSGLENLQDGSSITVNEFPIEAHSQLLPIFTDLNTAISNFRQQGVLIDRADTYVIGQQKIPALIGSQPIPGGEVGKYLVLYRGDVTVMLTFNVFDPRVLKPSIVEKTILSVRLAPAATLQQKVDRLPFSFRVTAPFRVGDAIGGSTALLPSFEGTDPAGLMPVVIIARSLSAIDPSANLELAARQLLLGTQGFENAEITSTREVEFGGGTAVFLEARAGQRTIAQFARIPPNGRYVRLVAFGETNQLKRVMPAVTEIAGSVAIAR